MVGQEFKSGAWTSAHLTNKKANNSENNSKVKLCPYSTPSPGIAALNPTLQAKSTHSIQQMLAGYHQVPAPGPTLLTVHLLTLTLPLRASVPPLKIWHRGFPRTKMGSVFPSGSTD